VQVFGGMGYIEETGAAQLMRDARICGIYEGANGIQAIDLVTRKLPLMNGEAVKREIDDMRVGATSAATHEAIEALAAASEFIARADAATALAGATSYLRLFALARGSSLLEKGAKVAVQEANPNAPRYAALANFFARNIAVAAPSLARSVMEGAESVTAEGLP